MSALGVLQRYARPVRGPSSRSAERCELCRAEVPPEHAHLVDLKARTLSCACRACALLFLEPGAAQGRYRTVPNRVLGAGERLPEDAWASLEIPVRLAFFFYNSTAARWVAQYPSPAGATECELPLEAWQPLVQEHPLISQALPDVEAIVAWGGRHPGGGFEVFVVPISDCYALVASVRRTWRGFDGGDDVRRELGGFFERLRERAEPFRGRANR